VHYRNDLAVSANNIIFITDSQSNKVYKIDRPSNDIEVFINSEEIPNCNGITISDNDQYLYLATDRGIGVVDISSKKILNVPQDQFSSIDGLKFHQNNLYGIVNAWGDSTLNGLFKFNLNDNLTEVVSNDRLVEFTEEFIIPTTFDIFDGHIYFIMNTQLGNLDTNTNEIIDLSTLESYKMLKINIE
ncbi:MAG: hypothetical protein NWP64_01070, partial [Maribacter sp.]|nr:hypothetical protein [Maribacter sp.]